MSKEYTVRMKQVPLNAMIALEYELHCQYIHGALTSEPDDFTIEEVICTDNGEMIDPETFYMNLTDDEKHDIMESLIELIYPEA